MADSGYRHFYGQDWPPVPDENGNPVPVTREFAGLVIGKKWRFFRDEQGIEFDVEPWVAMLESAKALMPGEYATVSEWTEQHFHDWCMCPKGIITIGCGSCAKAQPLDSRIYTPTGFTTFGEVKVGDRVLTPTGVSVVRKVHDIRNYTEYELRFSDGTSCRCADSHLWKVFSRRMDLVPHIMEAKDIPGRGHYYIETCRPASFEGVDVPVDPYVLGVLIGDGCLGGAGGKAPLSFTNIDADVVSAVEAALVPGYALHRDKRKPSYRIVNTTGTKRNSYISALRGLGLWGKVHCGKFVPDVYKYNSVEVRQAVLAGLLDTDGYVSREGVVSFSSVSTQLADDVAWLVESLGGTVVRSTGKAGYRRDGEYVRCHDVHQVFIHMRDATSLFRCGRKAGRVRVGVRGNRGRRYIEEVKPTGRVVPMRCITVEDPSGLYLTDNFIVTHNSYDTGHIIVLDYVVDPFDTVILLGSTTKEALKSRSWNFVQQCHAALKKNPLGLVIPGKITKAGYALVNVADDDNPESVGDKAGIQGRALNEDGNLQGAHAKFVRLVVDELATIRNHDAITTAMTNLRIGALDFKFAALANPESWDDPSCKYMIPEGGVKSVDCDTGFWTSTRGYWVRHHDGLKSPALTPEGKAKFPYLLSQDVIDDNLRDCDGNPDAPQMWKMVRGFPMSLNLTSPVVLDPKIAESNRVTETPEFMGPPLAVCAGIDPAWTQGGDGAIFQRVFIRSWNGKTVLDYTDGLRRLKIDATSSKPVMQQLTEQAIDLMRDPSGYPIPLSCIAVDASANQGLADNLDIFVGQGAATCIHVNYSMRASDRPIRFIAPAAMDSTKDRHIETCRDRYQDRGTESWCVLAEFCKAGMVKGLPEKTLFGLVNRRFMMATKKFNGSEVVSGTRFPLQLESKADYKVRYHASPDETDGGSLAALAAKEALGVLPFGWFAPAEAPLVGPASFTLPARRTAPLDYPAAGAYNVESSGSGYTSGGM